VSGRLRIILVVLGVTALVAVTAAVVWRTVLRDTATPASIDDALARYRATAAQGETPIPPGVYVYATTGSESISALGGTTHEYPPSSTITVTQSSCGMTLRWDVLETRSTTWDICVGGDGGVLQQLDGWVEKHVFFGQDDATEWMCTGMPWLLGSDAESATTSPTCDGGDAKMTGVVRVIGEEVVDVGAVSVETIRIRLEGKEDGAARGPLVEERWLEAQTGLPVRITYEVRTENDSLIGDVVFEERYDLRLESLEPRT